MAKLNYGGKGMKNYQELTDQQLSEVIGGGKGKRVGGIVYTLLGEWDDFKAGFKAGIKHK